MLGSAPIFACIFRSDGNCEWMNGHWSDRLGMPEQEIRRRGLPTLISDPHICVWQGARVIFDSNEVRVFDAPIETSTGDQLWVSWHMKVVDPDRRLLIGVETVSQQDLERQLISERALLAQIVDLIPYDVLWVDKNLRYLGCNQAHATRTGLDWPAQAVGLGGKDLPLSQGKSGAGARSRVDVFDAAARHVMETRQPVVSVRASHVHDDGREVHDDVSIFPLVGRDETSDGVVAVFVDQSESVALEEQMLQSSKLEAVGQLAAGIAHEINTPVQFVGDNCRFLQDVLADLARLLRSGHEIAAATLQDADAPVEAATRFVADAEAADLDFLLSEIPEAVAQSLDGIDRIANIVRAMKDFSHPGVESLESVDINRCISSTVTVATSEWKYLADLDLDLGENLAPVHGATAEINQVVLNLLVNAAHAIADRHGTESGSERGCIRITTRQVGDDIETTISDTGGGIPPEIADRIFDPFFTTKEVGRGTGQGLSIAHNIIVNKHGGQLTFTTEAGTGTTFVVRLPAVQADVTPAIRPES